MEGQFGRGQVVAEGLHDLAAAVERRRGAALGVVDDLGVLGEEQPLQFHLLGVCQRGERVHHVLDGHAVFNRFDALLQCLFVDVLSVHCRKIEYRHEGGDE